MPDRPTVRLPFGAGLNRSAGPYVVPPGVPRTLRDVLVEEGRVEARKGLTTAVEITLQNAGYAAQDIIHVMAFRAAGRGMLVAADYPGAGSGPNGIEFWRMSVTGFTPVYVGLMPSPTTPPKPGVTRIFGTEVWSRLFYAQDEPEIAERRTTRTINTSFVVSDLTANLDGAGVAPVKFRGVCRYLDYLIGWGFGSASDADRPEAIRVSLPNDPLTFRPTHYWLAGPRSEPVLNCVPGPGFVWALKETETYILRGTNSRNFTIELLDPRFGLAGSHLAVQVEGELFGWSRQGPRVWSGGASVDLGLPLDLGGPDPEDLVASGEAAYGWAEYDAVRRLVIFAFPNRDLGKTRAYCLSRRDPSNPRWSYIEWQRALMSAGTIYAVASGAPNGYPDQTPLAEVGGEVLVSWNNVSAAGDEVVEIWLKVGAGAYNKVREVAVSGASQSETLHAADGVIAGALHTVALRYRRGSYIASGYAGTVTSGWGLTEIAQSVESITTASAPTAPGSPSQTDCRITTIGGKQYLSVKVGWTNTVGAGTTEVLTNDVNDAATATLADTVTVSGLGLTQASGWVGGWLTTGGVIYYVFVRHRLPTGELGPAVLAATVNPADGCEA